MSTDPRLAVLKADSFADDYAVDLLAALDAVDPLRAALPATRADLRAANRALDLGQYLTVGHDLLAIASRLALLGEGRTP